MRNFLKKKPLSGERDTPSYCTTATIGIGLHDPKGKPKHLINSTNIHPHKLGLRQWCSVQCSASHAFQRSTQSFSFLTGPVKHCCSGITIQRAESGRKLPSPLTALAIFSLHDQVAWKVSLSNIFMEWKVLKPFQFGNIKKKEWHFQSKQNTLPGSACTASWVCALNRWVSRNTDGAEVNELDEEVADSRVTCSVHGLSLFLPGSCKVVCVCAHAHLSLMKH